MEIEIDAGNWKRIDQWRIAKATATKVVAENYRIQSTAKMRETFSVGRPSAVRTRSIVTNPALGMLAAPMLARVEVRLQWEQRFSVS